MLALTKKTFSTLVNLVICICCASCAMEVKQSLKEKSTYKPVAIATFTILADIANNVAGDRVDVRSITKPGAEIHGYQFTPSDLVKAQEADLVIENGLGLELWIEEFITSLGDVPRVILSEGMEPLLIEGDVYSGKPNPHAWMSPKRTIQYVDNLVDAFIELDPKGAEIYRTNANEYKQKLLELDKELKIYISSIPLNKRVLVTCEGAFTYLAKDYGMEEAYLWPVNSESQVTPRRMSRLISKIQEKEVPTIFCETTVSSKAQLQVAKSSGAKYGGNFFVDSLSNEGGPASSLLELQRYNVRLIKKGLAPEINSK
tara:strand:- start:65 stop:1009 length:945 start_codon:yes stop_codon:yes gene_type:complete